MNNLKRTVNWLAHHTAFALVAGILAWLLFRQVVGTTVMAVTLAIGFVCGWTAARTWAEIRKYLDRSGPGRIDENG